MKSSVFSRFFPNLGVNSRKIVRKSAEQRASNGDEMSGRKGPIFALFLCSIIASIAILPVSASIEIGTSANASGDDAIAIGDNSQATDNNATAIGTGAQATEDNATAIGAGAQATEDNATAIGTGAVADDAGAIAIGQGAKTNRLGNAAKYSADGAIAIGRNSNVQYPGSIAIGDGAKVTIQSTKSYHRSGIAIGKNSEVNHQGGVAIGDHAINKSGYGIAIGTDANAYGDEENMIAIGHSAQVNGKSAIGFGASSGAYGDGAIAIGSGAKADGGDGTNHVAVDHAIAIGKATASGAYDVAIGFGTAAHPEGNATAVGVGANANAKYATALGAGATADTYGNSNTDGGTAVGYKAKTANRSVAIGGNASAYNSTTDFNYATAVGYNTKATGNTSSAFGAYAQATGTYSVAIGGDANQAWLRTIASGTGATAVGSGAQATKSGALSLGYGAKATYDKSVAIGSNSLADQTAYDRRLDKKASTTLPGSITIENRFFAGTGDSVVGVVSFGNASSSTATTRLLTNVAAGNIASDSTDAINGSQLYRVLENLQAGSDANLTFMADDFDDSNESIKAVSGATKHNNDRISIISGDFTNKSGEYNATNLATYVDGNGNIKIGMKPDLYATSVGNGDTNITLNGDTIELKSDGKTLIVDGETIGNGESNVTFNDKKIELVSGENGDKLIIDGKIISDENSDTRISLDDDKITLTSAGKNIIVDGETIGNGESNVTFNDKKIELVSGKNGDKLTIDGNEISSDDEIKFTTNEKTITIKENTIGSGSSKTTYNENNVTITAGGKDVAFTPVGDNVKISNVAPGTADTDAVNLSQLKSAADGNKTHYFSANDGGTHKDNYDNLGAKGTDSLAIGPKASTTDEAANSVALGTGATASHANSVALGSDSVTGEAKSIADVTIDGTKYEFAGDDKVTGVVSVGGKDGATRQITNVAPGAVSASSTDAINGSQLYAVTQAVEKSAIHYFDVNSSDTLNYENNGASGDNAMAVGVASATGTESVAMGYNATATAGYATALGASASAGAANSVAIGYNAVVNARDGGGFEITNGVAIGSNSLVEVSNSTALGTGAKVTVANSVAVGYGSTTENAEYKRITGIKILGTQSRSFAGSGPNLGIFSVGAKDAERQIKFVAAGDIGANSTDAINGSQLYAVIEEMKTISTSSSGSIQYFDVNSTHNLNKTNLGASAINAIAIGVAEATEGEALALGYLTSAKGIRAIAIGTGSKATSTDAVAIGQYAEATQSLTVAIGREAKAQGEQSTVIGYSAEAKGYRATAIGEASDADGKESTAIGTGTHATGEGSIALGDGAYAGFKGTNSGYGAVAIGKDAQARADTSIAIGVDAGARSDKADTNYTAIGTSSHAGEKAVAVGAGSDASATGVATGFDSYSGVNSVASGVNSKASKQSVAIGGNANADPNNGYAVAVGYNTVSYQHAVSLGNEANALSNYSVAIGDVAKIGESSNYSVTIGYNTEVTGTNSNVTYGAVAIGGGYYSSTKNSIKQGATVTGTGAIAIGGATQYRAGANANGVAAIAIGSAGNRGDAASATGFASMAIGSGGYKKAGAVAVANSMAIGSASGLYKGANVSAEYAMALGSGTETSVKDSVALGVNSLADQTAFDRKLSKDKNSTITNLDGDVVITIPNSKFAGIDTNVTGVLSVGRSTYDATSGKLTALSTRLVTNVAAGNIDENSTDAINGSQLYAVIAGMGASGDPIHYFSVNDGDDNRSNWYNDGAEANNSMAIGIEANASKEGAMAIGWNSHAIDENSTAIGINAEANGTGAIAFGWDTNASKIGATAIGWGASASGENAIAFGTDANASGENSSAIGLNSVASNKNAIAFGTDANASGENSTAIGKGAIAYREGTIAIGNDAFAGNNKTTRNVGNYSIAIGDNSEATITASIALGNNAVAGTGTTGGGAIAIGGSADVKKDGAKATGSGSIAIGAYYNTKSVAAYVKGARSIAIGNNANVNGDDSIALGASRVSAKQSGAIGYYNVITSESTYVLGNYVNVIDNERKNFDNNNGEIKALGYTITNSIYLGDRTTMVGAANDTITRRDVNGSGAQYYYYNLAKNNAEKNSTQTGGAYGTVSYAFVRTSDDTNVTYSGFAGEKSNGGVSVGYAGGERRIMNVAAGLIDENSTDAINGSQLYAVLANFKSGTNISYFSVNSTEEGNKKNDGAEGNNSMAIGPNAHTDKNATSAIAFGYGADATEANATAIGTDANASGESAIALGTGASASEDNATAIGTDANASGIGAVAIGTDASAEGNSSIALGDGATSEGNNSIALGTDANASGESAIAFGDGATAEGNSSIAFGDGAKAEGNNSIASGTGATASGTDTIAMGTGATASEANATAIGNGATATHENSVALGSGSATTEIHQPKDFNVTNPNGDVIAEINASKFAGGDNIVGVVSLGNADKNETRQITNLAPGVIDANSTDAVNGSQLYSVVQAVADSNLTFAARGLDDNNKTNLANGGVVRYNGQTLNVLDGNFTLDTNYSSTNLATYIDKAGNLLIGMRNDLNVSSISNSDNGNEISLGDENDKNITITSGENGDTLGIGGDTIYKPDTNTSIAFNDDDVTITSGEKGESIVISGDTISDATGGSSLEFNDKNITMDVGGSELTFKPSDKKDGNVTISGVAAGVEDNDAVNVSQLKEFVWDANITFGADTGTPFKVFNGNQIDINTTTPNLTTFAKDNGIYIDMAYDLNVSSISNSDNGNEISLGDENDKNITFTVGGNELTFSPSDDGNVTISGVAPGKAPNDAVNVSQLEANTTRYFSVNDGGNKQDNYNNDGAKGENSIAIGPNASTDKNATGAVALGDGAKANKQNATAIGKGANASGEGSIATGGANASGNNSQASGTGAIASKENAIATGTGAEASGKNSQASGTGATAVGENAIAMGNGAKANDANTTAIGTNAKATNTNAIATGVNSEATGADSQASGTGAKASGTNAYASGTNASAQGENAQATGTGAKASGTNAYASGTNSYASGDNTQAIGTGARATSENATAIGTDANASGTNSLAIGKNAKTEQANSVALGSNTVAGNKNEVGDVEIKDADGNTITTIKADSFAGGKNVVGVVSVGNGDETRQITNVAPGRVTNTSTDAVNGSQLYSVLQAVSDSNLTFKARGNDSKYSNGVTRKTGETQNILDGDFVVDKNYSGTNLSTYVDANGNILIGMALDLNVSSIGNSDNDNQISLGDKDDKNITISSNGDELGIGGTTIYNPDGSTSMTFNEGNITQNVGDGTLTYTDAKDGNVTITGVAAGVNDNDAVNVSQLKNVVEGNATHYFSVNSTDDGNRDNSGAKGDNSMAIGPNASTTENATSAIALGDGATAKEANATAIGTGATASGKDSIATGSGAKAEATGAIATGSDATASGENSQASGTGAKAENENAIASGTGATASGSDSIAFGTGSKATDTNATAIGNGSSASKENAVAIGSGAKAEHENSIALGNGSTTNEIYDVEDVDIKDADGKVIGTIKADTFAGGGDNIVGVVSVGNADTNETRQITNVAPGRVTSDSTDAVNGSQLYAVVNEINTINSGLSGGLLHFNADNNNSVTKALGDTLAIVSTEDEFSVSGKSGNFVGKNVATRTVVDSNGSGRVEIGITETPEFKSVDVADGSGNTTNITPAGITVTNKNGSNTTYGSDGMTITKEGDKEGPKFTANEISAGGNKITNVAPGEDDTDAVNVSQLKQAVGEVRVEGAGDIIVTSKKNGAYGTVYTVSYNGANSNSWVTVNNTSGEKPVANGENSVAIGNGSVANEANTVSVGDVGSERRITNVAPAVNDTDAVNLSQLKSAIGNVYNDMHNYNKEHRAGIATAMAIGDLPQSFIPGKSMFVMGTSYYKGQGALALGLSRVSDNSKWIIKGSAAMNSQSDVGATLSFGFHF